MLKYIGDGSFLLDVPARDLHSSLSKIYNFQYLVSTGLYAEAPDEDTAVTPDSAPVVQEIPVVETPVVESPAPTVEPEPLHVDTPALVNDLEANEMGEAPESSAFEATEPQELVSSEEITLPEITPAPELHTDAPIPEHVDDTHIEPTVPEI